MKPSWVLLTRAYDEEKSTAMLMRKEASACGEIPSFGPRAPLKCKNRMQDKSKALRPSSRDPLSAEAVSQKS
jgi:hypothetical protein